MKVTFRTNIYHYQTNCFPTNLENAPRIGETVLITEVFLDYYSKQKLPLRMEVVDVIWTEKGVICELSYKKNDIEFAKISNVKLF